MTSDDKKLVLVVDADQRFIDTARSLLHNHRALAARDLDEAREIVLGGRVDVVVLGADFASEASVAAAGALREADPTVEIVLCADVVSNRLLKAALRGGLADVVDLPLTATAVALILGETTSPTPPAEIEFIVDPAPAAQYVAPLNAEPAAPASPAVIDVPVVETEQSVAAVWEQTVVSEAPIAPVAPAVHSGEPPIVQTPVVQQIPSTAPTEAPIAHPAPTAEVAPIPQAPPMPAAPVAAMPPVQEPPVQVFAPPVVSEPVAVAPVAAMPPVEQPPAPVLAPPAGVTQQIVEIPSSPTGLPTWAESAPAGHATAPAFAPQAPPVADAPVWPDPAPASPPPQVAPAPPFSAPPAPQDSPVGMPIPGRPTSPPPPMPIREDDNQPPRSAPGQGRVIAVMAGKGGSGKSVIATNLAIAIGLRHDPERVAIVDADLQFGDVALMLQLDPIRTIDDVIGHMDSMSDSRLEGALLRHESGLRVLAAPLLPVRGGEIPGKSVVEIIDRLRRLYDTIIVDTGPVFDDHLVTILENADAVVTVVDMDLPSVKNAKVALDALRSSGFPMDRITMVVNRVNSKARLDLVELERSLGLRVGGSVPSDRLVPQSVNEGIPLLALSPRSKVARSFLALAERMDPESDRQRITGR